MKIKSSLASQDFKWWLSKLPTILKYARQDTIKIFDMFTGSRLWITLLIIWNLFSIYTYLSGWISNPWAITLMIAQITLQLVFIFGFTILQLIIVSWLTNPNHSTIITPESPKTLSFEDYPGRPILVKDFSQWLNIISNPEDFLRMGGNLIKGHLIYGPPGTGKSYLARCLAGEGKSALVSIEGSGFRGLFSGLDSWKVIAYVRLLKKLAKQYGSCIGYIDDIDTIAQNRSTIQTSGSGALSQLLYEMDSLDEGDGFWEKFRNKWFNRLGVSIPPRKWHVMFMGSATSLENLDSTLIHPGHMDYITPVNYPDSSGRRAIIQYYLDKVSHDDTINLDALVEDTNNTSPALIMSTITKEAVRNALLEGRSSISQKDIERGFVQITMGPESSVELKGKQLEQVAYHEAGHAVITHYVFREEKRINRATVIGRGTSLGHMKSTDREEDVLALPLSRLHKEVLVLLAGQEATIHKFGEPWSGPIGDYNTVNFYVDRLLLNGSFGPPQGTLEKLRDLYKKDIREYWIERRQTTGKLIEKYWPEVVAVAEALMKHQTLSGDALVEIMNRIDSERKSRATEDEIHEDDFANNQ